VRLDIMLSLLAIGATGCSSFRSHDARIAGLADPDPEERYENLLALADETRNPETANDLCDRAFKMVDDAQECAAVKLVALRVLGRLGKEGIRTKDIAQKLANHASKGTGELNFWCRIEAVEGLASLVVGPQNTLPDESVRGEVDEALLKAIRADQESDHDVRIHAARELALLRPDSTKALNELVGALSDETPDVRYHAERALIAIAGGDHGPHKQDWDRWVRSQQTNKGESPK